ncbi:MAG: tetratricopeptide repeat protein, partial [Desulfatiglandaceae bacterium]
GNIAEPLFEKPLQTEGLSSDPSTVSGPYLLSPITKNQPKRESLRYMTPVTEGFPERKTIASTKQIHYLVPEKGREGVSRIQETVSSSPPLKQKTPIIISSVIPFSRPVEEPSQDTPTPEPEESPLSPAVGADAKFVSEGLLRNSGRERPEEVRKEQQASAGHMEKNHQVSDMDRSAEVSRLVARIQEGMRGGDKAMVVDLLGKLESIKGPGNDYVMRLRAFWFLKQGKYDAARRLLKALLEKDDNDIEAGVNMAILDIKTNHVQMARKRLLRMRRNNEDNALIPAIMEKISD